MKEDLPVHPLHQISTACCIPAWGLIVLDWHIIMQVGEIFHCADAYVTLVMVDHMVRPVQLPFELSPQSKVELLRYKVRSVAHHMGSCRKHERVLTVQVIQHVLQQYIITLRATTECC